MVLEILSYARAIGRSVIKSLFDAGYSANAGLNLLIREGAGYRRQDFLADWRELVSTAQKETFFSSMPDYVRPTRAMMTPKAFPVGEKYRYTFKVNLYDPVTKETFENKPYSIGVDRILSVGEAEETLAVRLETDTEKGLEYIGGYLIGVARRE